MTEHLPVSLIKLGLLSFGLKAAVDPFTDKINVSTITYTHTRD